MSKDNFKRDKQMSKDNFKRDRKRDKRMSGEKVGRTKLEKDKSR